MAVIGEIYGSLDRLVFVFCRDGGGRQDRDGDLSVSVGGVGNDDILLDGNRFHPRAF